MDKGTTHRLNLVDLPRHQAIFDAHKCSILDKYRLGEIILPCPGTFGTKAFVADVLYAIPFIVTRNMTIDRLYIEVTVLDAGSQIRLGIYRDGVDLYPGALVHDYGLVSGAAVAVVHADAVVALTKGLYWLVAVSDGTPTIRGMYPIFSPWGQLATNLSSIQGHLEEAAVGFGALADPCSGGMVAWATINHLICPRILSLD